MDYRCLFCQAQMLQKRLEKNSVANTRAIEISKHCLKMLAESSFDKPMPDIASEIHREFRKQSRLADPFLHEKEESSRYMKKNYQKLKSCIEKADDSFDSALRIAIAANIIDFGPGHHIAIDKTIEHTLKTPLSIDHTSRLKENLGTAKTVLYLADNAGEIYADKLFIENAMPDKKVYFVVRGAPILNDATTREALEAGIDTVAEVLSNEDDAPSNLLYRVSPRVRELFHSVDLIIAKGMGNFEGLMSEEEAKLFFLFTVKCDVIAELVGAPKGANVVKCAAK